MNEEALKNQAESGDPLGESGDGKRHMTPLRTAMAIGLMVMTIAFLIVGLKMGSQSPTAETAAGTHPLKARLFRVNQVWQAAVGSVHGVDPSTRFTIAEILQPQAGLLDSEHVTPLGSATVSEIRERLSILEVTWQNTDPPSRLDDLWVYATPTAGP